MQIVSLGLSVTDKVELAVEIVISYIIGKS